MNNNHVQFTVHSQYPSSNDLNELLCGLNERPTQNGHDYRKIVVKRKVISFSDFVQYLILCRVSPAFAELVRRGCILNYLRNSTNSYIVISFHVELNQARLFVDRYWNACILKLVLFQMELEDSLSWLSTLGGAFSSYGEFNVQYARKAQRVSFNQLRLARTHGDPNLIGRALIYICYAGCQQGYKRLVKHFVRRQVRPYISSIDPEHRDRIVEQMFYGLCYRIKHFY